MSISLAKAELSVMKLLWIESPQTARQLREALYPDSFKTQHGTVQKLLERLEEKGFIHRDRSLTVHLFSAAITHGEYSAGQLESLANNLTEGSIAPLITNFVHEKKISTDEIGRLRELLDDLTEKEDVE